MIHTVCRREKAATLNAARPTSEPDCCAQVEAFYTMLWQQEADEEEAAAAAAAESSVEADEGVGDADGGAADPPPSAARRRRRPLRFPEHYPTSCVVGRVTVVDCVTPALLGAPRAAALGLSAALRGESESDFILCCARPRVLPLPVAGRSGDHKFWEITNEEAKGFARALVAAQPPAPVWYPPPGALRCE